MRSIRTLQLHPVARHVAVVSSAGQGGRIPLVPQLRHNSQRGTVENNAAEVERIVAGCLRCVVDERCRGHSKQVMEVYLQRRQQSSTTLDDPINEDGLVDFNRAAQSFTASLETTEMADMQNQTARVSGRPGVNEIVSAVARYLLQRQQVAPRPKLLHLSGERSASPYLFLIDTYTDILSSVVKQSVDAATWRPVGENGTVNHNTRPAMIAPLHKHHGLEDASGGHFETSFDALIAARHAAQVLATPSCRAELQKFGWPQAAALHGSIVKRAKALFYPPPERRQSSTKEKPSKELCKEGKRFLKECGLKSPEELCAELFHFPGDTFLLFYPGDSFSNMNLTPAETARAKSLMASTNYAVMLSNNSWRHQDKYSVKSAALVATMGEPPTDAFLLANKVSTNEKGKHAKTLPAVEDSRERHKTFDALDLSARLWLLLCEMTQLRQTVVFLLMVELALSECKRCDRALSDDAGSSLASRAAVEGHVLDAVGNLWYLAGPAASKIVQHGQDHFSSCARLFAGTSMRAPSPSYRSSRAVTASDHDVCINNNAMKRRTLPERYTSVTQLYNEFATVLRNQQIGI